MKKIDAVKTQLLNRNVYNITSSKMKKVDSMKKQLINRCQFLQFVITALLLSHHLHIFADDSFGYISYMTTNIGDDIQAIAAKKVLPSDSCHIDREFIGSFESSSVVHTIVNGWYMHTRELSWYRPDISPPETSWPPSSCIDPLLISIYFWPPFESIAFSEEGIEYLKNHAPIGARDYSTLEKLQALEIPSYFSGCLTLTLDNPYKGKRDEIIYAVDVSQRCLDYLRRNTQCHVVELTHGITRELFFENNHEKRLIQANTILDKYQRAKCVVTQRLHAAMPCLAFRTPVLLISPPDNGRMHGLRELTWHCTEDELIHGKVQFDFDCPPENPKDYLKLREQLIEKVSSWVEQKKQSFTTM